MDRIKKAPGTKLTNYTDVFGKSLSEHCGDRFDESERNVGRPVSQVCFSEFWSGFQELEKEWQVQSKLDGCDGPVNNTDEACK